MSTEKLSLEDFAKKIAWATPLQRVNVNFELITYFLEEAETALYKEENVSAYEKNIDKAHGYLKLLASSLDMQYDLSQQLLSIYIYVNKLLLTGKAKKDTHALADAKKILAILHDGFLALQEEETESEDLKRFAGLTYNCNGELDEYCAAASQSEYQA